jgi:hypothetical protein
MLAYSTQWTRTNPLMVRVVLYTTGWRMADHLGIVQTVSKCSKNNNITLLYVWELYGHTVSVSENPNDFNAF